MHPGRWRDLEKPSGYRSPLAGVSCSKGQSLAEKAKHWARKESARLGTPQTKQDARKELNRLFA